MKKLLLLLPILFVACSTPESIDVYNNSQNQQTDCGTIVSSGEDQRGDYIEVRMDYQKQYEKNRYKVSNYMDYKLGNQICNFDGLTQQPL